MQLQNKIPNCARPLIVIVGPTAVGKTAISLQLAENLGGEIVSADSRLFYRGMDIGTAKPTPAELARAPHHLIDVATPDQDWSLATFQGAAYRAIDEIHARGRLPIMVGGTGQYVQAVLEGWQLPAARPNAPLRQALQSWAGQIGTEGLHQRLGILDPAAAASIDPTNLRRTIRALEVILQNGQLFSTQKRRSPPAYQTLILGLQRPRPELYARIDQRIAAMLQAGFVAEVQALLDQGYSPDLPPLSAIGYRQIIAHLQGQITLDEAVALMKRLTRQFVRRQANWFKESDPAIYWFRVEPGTAAVLEQLVLKFVKTLCG